MTPAPVEKTMRDACHDLAGLTVPTDADPATRERLTAAVNRSFVWSFRWIMGIAAALGMASAIRAGLTIPNDTGGV